MEGKDNLVRRTNKSKLTTRVVFLLFHKKKKINLHESGGIIVKRINEEIENEIKELEEINKERIVKDYLRQQKRAYLNKKRQEEVKLLKRTIERNIRLSFTIFLLYFSVMESHKIINLTNSYITETAITNDDVKEKLYSKICAEIASELTIDKRILPLNAVIENNNLVDTDKKIIYKFKNLLLENPYLDTNNVYNSLKTVKIVNGDKDIFSNVLGRYHPGNNLIEIFVEKAAAKCYKETLQHEIAHCIFYSDNSNYLPTFFKEGITELLINEYFSDKPYAETDSYCFEIIMVKQLCNMIGADKVLKAFSIGDITIISNELSKTMSEEKSNNFLLDLELLFDFYEEHQYLSFDMQENLTRIIEYLEEFDTKRYCDLETSGESVYNREILKLLETAMPNFLYYNYLIVNGVYIKPYFSQKLIERDKEHYLDYDYLFLDSQENDYSKESFQKVKKRSE